MDYCRCFSNKFTPFAERNGAHKAKKENDMDMQQHKWVNDDLFLAKQFFNAANSYEKKKKSMFFITTCQQGLKGETLGSVLQA